MAYFTRISYISAESAITCLLNKMSTFILTAGGVWGCNGYMIVPYFITITPTSHIWCVQVLLSLFSLSLSPLPLSLSSAARVQLRTSLRIFGQENSLKIDNMILTWNLEKYKSNVITSHWRMAWVKMFDTLVSFYFGILLHIFILMRLQFLSWCRSTG